MNAEHDVLTVLVKIERTRAERTIDAARHAYWQIGDQFAHGGRRRPIGPNRLAADFGVAAP